MGQFRDALKAALGLEVKTGEEIRQSLAEKLQDGEKHRLENPEIEAEEEVVLCSYCQREAVAATGEEVYPHREDLYHLKFYKCDPCGARVGCHKDTGLPYGRMANAELRRAKMDAHAAFDSLWKGSMADMRRNDAYKWLSEKLSIERDSCHIGMFTVEQCKEVIQVLEEYWEGA